MNEQLKDWEIAQIMFGKNTKKECKLVKHLRKHGVISPLIDDWSIIKDSKIKNDCGLLISNDCL